MYKNDFRLALAYAARAERAPGNDVALLYENDELWRVQQAALVNAVQTSANLPIVRLLRGYGRRFTSHNTYIYTTAVPTEACLGMARLCGISSIYCLSGGRLYEAKTRRNAVEWKNYAMTESGAFPNVTAIGSGSVVRWYNNPGGSANELKAWVKAVAQGEGSVATGADDVLTFPVRDAPASPPVFGESGFEDIPLQVVFRDRTLVDNMLMMLAFEMVGLVHGDYHDNPNRQEVYYGQNIGCLLADDEGQIVGWGVNTNAANATQHGETNTIINYLVAGNASLPAGGTLYTTLEPCEMCSGMIVRAVKTGDNFRVIYGQADPNVGGTALKSQVKNTITMTASTARRAAAPQIKAGTATGAVTAWPTALREAHEASPDAEITRFVERTTTRRDFFALGRPNWWLYLWDTYMTRVGGLSHSADLTRARPEVETAYQVMESMYKLSEGFMARVRRRITG